MSERILITGGNGQLGKALSQEYKDATSLDKTDLDIADMKQVEAIDWRRFNTIINAAAYVNADHSETPEGRKITWESNAIGPRNLAKIALKHNLHLIHVSSEYVYDGETDNHLETEIFSPLSVYGQTKAAADLAVSLVPNHHILRTSWVVGDGHNFIKTMKNLGDMRIDPKVVDDQYGRLTFTSELTRAVNHILENNLEAGTYNLSNSGKIRSWADIATLAFKMAGHSEDRVKRISTEEYKRDKETFAPRPKYSALDLSKIQSTGFESRDYEPLVEEYINSLERVE